MRQYRDEDDVHVRAGRRSRPRSGNRPRHTKAVPALVTTVDRGRYTCSYDGRFVTAMLARELGRAGVVVGDTVEIVGDLSGNPGTLARIVRIVDRTTVLRRSTDDGDPTERIIVANAKQLVIVASLADPPPRLGLIDRYLIAAEDAGITPLLVLTKADLAAPDDVIDYYAKVELDIVTWQRGAPATPISDRLTDPISVLVGHSGVGKTTLLNALVPGVDRRTGTVSTVGKGRHTTTAVSAFELPGGGWVIDTPGIRSFGLAHIPVEDLLHGYPDLLPGSLDCESGCDHAEPKSSCALDAWVAKEHIPAGRLESFRALRASLSA